MPSTQQTALRAEDPLQVPRRLGSYVGDRPGPLLLILGGIHGNEPAGVEAARQLLAELKSLAPPMRGRVIALQGNRRALASGQRFLETDLNRGWSVGPRLGRADRTKSSAEDVERSELAAALTEALGEVEAKEPVIFLDCHTFSSWGPPFSIAADTVANRRFALRLGLPLVLGLEERVDGALLQSMLQRCDVALVAEGGNHEDAQSRDVLRAVMWRALVQGGLLRAKDCPELGQHRALMKQVTKGAPRVSEVRYIHEIEGVDGFRMRDGYRNFEPVSRGEPLGIDREGAVQAPSAGFVLMPLYQTLGHEGYFLVSRWSRLRRAASIVARRLHLDGLLPLLPGIRRAQGSRDTFEVTPSRYPADLFRFFGYRIEGESGERVAFARRRTRHGDA